MTDRSSGASGRVVVPALSGEDLSTLYGQDLVGLLWLDAHGRIARLNDRGAAQLGSPAPLLVGTPLTQLVRDRDADALQQALDAVGIEPSRTLVVHVERAGSWAHVGMAVCRIGDRAGDTPVLVLVADRGPSPGSLDRSWIRRSISGPADMGASIGNHFCEGRARG